MRAILIISFITVLFGCVTRPYASYQECLWYNNYNACQWFHQNGYYARVTAQPSSSKQMPSTQPSNSNKSREEQFKDGIRNGQGTYIYANGDKYVGQFKNDNYDGFGTLYNADGSIKQQGLWRDDKFVQAQTPPTVTPPVVPKPPVIAPVTPNPPVIAPVTPKPPVNNAQDIKRQKCIRLGLAPGSADFLQCMN